MTTTDYLINVLFVFIVFRQAQERRIDRRYFVLPLVLVAYVATQYVHSLPTAGNDLVLIAALACVGLTLGTIAGLATHVRRDQDGDAFARVGWLAGILLVAGISSRMIFAFAISHGLEPAVRVRAQIADHPRRSSHCARPRAIRTTDTSLYSRPVHMVDAAPGRS